MSADNKNAPVQGNLKEEQKNKTSILQSDNEQEIDLIDLGYALIEKWYYILFAFLLGAVILNVYAYFCVKPTYESTSKLYVVSASSDSVVDLSDLNLGTSLTSDYEELMLSYPVLDQVIYKLGLDMDSNELAEMITLENPTDTRVLAITVTSTDPEEAKNIANTLADIAVEYLPETMSTYAPNIAQEARLADEKAGPSYTRYTLLGALIGAIIYCLIVIVGYLLDDTIHTASDMEKYFGIVPLASIPESEQFVQGDTAPEEEEDKGRKFMKGKLKS